MQIGLGLGLGLGWDLWCDIRDTGLVAYFVICLSLQNELSTTKPDVGCVNVNWIGLG